MIDSLKSFLDESINSLRIEDRNFERNRNGYNINVGLEYFLSKESSITGTYFFRDSDNKNLSNNIILITLLLIFIYSFYAVSEYIKDNENKDPKEVVIDEFIGQSIPIYLYEISHKTIKDPQEAVLFYLYIFILFRYFDIKKPFPVIPPEPTAILD